MAKKQLTYADALKILGQDDSTVLDFAEALVDGGLELVGVPDVLGARGALVRKGREAVGSLRTQISGAGRLDRMERIEAALKIIAVVSMFEAAEEALVECGAPFTLAELKITRGEQWALIDSVDSVFAGQYLSFSTRSEAARPVSPIMGTASFATTLLDFLSGLAQWDRCDETIRQRISTALRASSLTATVQWKFDGHYLGLITEVPELRLHAELVARSSMEEQVVGVGRGLHRLHDLLSEVSTSRPVHRRLQELSAVNKAVVQRPILKTQVSGTDVVLPSALDAYVPPSARFAYPPQGSAALLSSDAWWDDQDLRQDTSALIAGLLTMPRCLRAPIAVLGHPGAGKSKLTEMIAVHLPESDFLAIRVELRDVTPNAPVHRQIDEGLRAFLHTDTSWRELADLADGALPVVILDGFDELLQATGVDRSDYLEQVQEFQRQQEELGRPVAVIVTSRTVIAHRMRFPRAVPVIKLEPFDARRIGALIDVWNRANAPVLASAGLAPITPDTVLAHRELAEQPLLLMMLLIYDSTDNALQREGGTLSRSVLYERLLAMFARREIEKTSSNLSDRALDEAVDGELRRLEIVAMSMFTRQRQTVSAEELEQDLATLFPDAGVRPDDAQFHGAISNAEQVLGRFFFVHESRAKQRDGTASVFEFLHATFGEYLTARFVVATLDDLVIEHAASRRRRFARPLDDGLLYAIGSFAVYSARAAIVEFIEELLETRFTDDPDAGREYIELLLSLFHAAPYPQDNRSFTSFAPERRTIVYRQSAYSANLVILLACCGESIDLAELFPDAEVPWQALRSEAAHWRTLHDDEWHGLVDTVRVRHLGGMSGEVTSVLERERDEPVNVGECIGFELHANHADPVAVLDSYEIIVPTANITGKLLRGIAVRANGTAARSLIVLLPYLRHVSTDVFSFFTDGRAPTSSWSESHDILRLRLTPAAVEPGERLKAYKRLLDTDALGRIELLVLRQAADDLGILDAMERKELAVCVARYLENASSVVEGLGDGVHGRDLAAVFTGLDPHLHEIDDYLDGHTASRDHLLNLAEQGSTVPPASPGTETRSRTVAKSARPQGYGGSAGWPLSTRPHSPDGTP